MTHETASVDPARTVQVFAGAEGFARFRITGNWTVPDSREFRADWHTAAVDGVQVSEWRSTALSGVPISRRTDSVRLDAIIGGRLQYRFDEVVHTGEPGSVHLIHEGHSPHIVIPGGVRVARVTLHEDAAPVWLRDTGILLDGPLPRTTLTSGFVALLDRLTAAIRDDPDELPLATARAIGVLASALLEEAIPGTGAESGDLRTRIVAHIDHHLGDVDLGPRRIADEFGISLRWVHRVFNHGEESVARYIRERRVDAIALQLRSERRWVRVADLAFRFGFAGRDQLTRAFKQRYGLTVNEYLDLVVQGGEPPAPIEH